MEQRVPAMAPEAPYIPVVKEEVSSGAAECQRDLRAVEEGVQIL